MKMQIVVNAHPELAKVLAQNNLGHVAEFDISQKDWRRLFAEAERQHREESYEQLFLRVCYRWAAANLKKDSVKEAMPLSAREFRWWAGIGLTLLLLQLTLSTSAHAQMDGLEIQNSGGSRVKMWAGGIAKVRCSTNLTCTFSSGVLSMSASSSAGSSWDSLTNPATGNLALSHGAFTTTFTWGNTTSIGNLFRLTDTLNNTGTGYLFQLDTASGSTLKVVRFCYRGTANCVTMDADIFQAIGSAQIVATSGDSATGFFSSGTIEDARIDGSAEADEVVLAGDVDGTANANDIDEVAVESELEGVLDLPDLQGTLTLAKGGTNQTTWTAGRCVQVNAGGTALEAASAACGSGGGGGTTITTARLTANQSTTGTTPIDITDLAVTLSANTNYIVRCELPYETAAATTGLALSWTTGATVTSARYNYDIRGGSGDDVDGNESETTATTEAIQTSSNATDDSIAHLSVLIRVGASGGTLTPRFRSEVSGSNVTVFADSFCESHTF